MQPGPPPFPPPWSSPAGPPPPPVPSPWAVVAAVLVGCWAVGVTVLGQVAGWLVAEVLSALGLESAPWQWPLVAVVNGLLVGLPVLLLALLPRSAAVRATGRAWLAATVALVLLGVVRAVPIGAHELYLLVTAVVAVGLAALLRQLARRRTTAPRSGAAGGSPLVPAVAVGAAMLLPWLWVGALGGLTETLCAAAAAGAVGLLAGQVLDRSFWAAFQGGTGRPVRPVLVAGLVAGVALLLLGAGTGHAGTQLALLFALPAVAFALAAVQQAGVRHGTPAGPAPVAWLVGLTLFGPLAFADPEEISLLLSMERDVPYWVLIGTLTAVAVGLLIGAVYGVVRSPGGAGCRAARRRPSPWWCWSSPPRWSTPGPGAPASTGNGSSWC